MRLTITKSGAGRLIGRWAVVVLGGLFAAGCAHQPPPPLLCRIDQLPIAVQTPESEARLFDEPVSSGAVGLDRFAAPPAIAPGTLGAAVRDIMTSRPVAALNRAPVANELLILSGGSQQGSFGAGYLDEWSKRKGGLPAFRVVTGISTGALQATFAFTGETNKIIDGYEIDREDEILHPYGRGVLSLVRKGAAGNLDPLRAKLGTLIDDETLRRVSEGVSADPAARRLLAVGVVDADLGQAIAFDMTKLAQRYVQATDTDKPRIKACYIEALVASASAPLAAPPAFIDNHMYIDGGARFGMFSEELLQGMASSPGASRATMIVNGTLETKPQCGKTRTADCAPPKSSAGTHKAWNIVSLGLRSEKILQNQVYRFSAAYVQQQHGDALRTVRIRPDSQTHLFVMPKGRLGDGQTSRACAAWSEIDDAIDRPVEFGPRYMRCLIDYGRARAQEDIQ